MLLFRHSHDATPATRRYACHADLLHVTAAGTYFRYADATMLITLLARYAEHCHASYYAMPLLTHVVTPLICIVLRFIHQRHETRHVNMNRHCFRLMP